MYCWAAGVTVGEGSQRHLTLSLWSNGASVPSPEEAQALTQELTDFRCPSSCLLRYVEALGDSWAHFHWFFLWLNALSEFRSSFLDGFASKFSTFD